MTAIITKTIRDNRRSWLAYTGISALLVWMYVAIFPSLAEQSANFEKLLEGMPAGFLEAFGVEATSAFSSIEAFLGTEHYSLMWPIILIILVVSLGGAAVAGEISSGTIKLLLAQPISRSRLYWGKLWGAFLVIAAFVFASVFTVVPFAAIYDVTVLPENHLTIAVLGLLLGWAILGMSMLASSVFDSRGKVAGSVAGLLILMYAFNIIANLKDSLEWLKYTSFFHYFDHNAALVENVIALENAVVLFAVGVVTAVLGWLIFNRRDLVV